MKTPTKTTWRAVRLGDIADVKNGKTNTQDAVAKGAYPLFDRSTQIKRSDKYLFDTKAVILPGEGAEFVPRYFEGKFDLHQRAYAIIPRPQTDSHFLFYSIFANRNIFSQNAVGSTVKSLRMPIIQDVQILLPADINTQKRIAGVLGAFDEKIENNNRIITTLEEMAQAIFKEWFAVPAGALAKEGKLPKGWEVKKLEDIADITIGRTPPRHEQHWFLSNGQGKKWISIKDMGDSGAYIFNTAEQLSDEAVNKFNVQNIPANTVVVSFKLTLGRVAITTEEMTSNEAIAHLHIKNGNGLFPEYLYLFMKGINLADFGSTSSIGTAVNSKTVRQVPILVPEGEILNNAKNVLMPIFVGIRSKIQENQKLITTRDLLLPRLMSGEIRV